MSANAKPRLIGLVGGIASGKSLVAEQLQALGGVLLDADRAGHDVLREKEVIEALHERWGDGIIALDGSLSRSVIAKITDRGPVSRSLLIDLSPRCAEELDMKRSGIATVSIEPVAPAPQPTVHPGPLPSASQSAAQVVAQTASPPTR